MKIAIIGLGHLGGALLEGLLKSGVSAGDIYAFVRADKVLSVRRRYGITSSDDINAVLAAADTVFLVTKSASFEELAKSIDRVTLERTTVVSFMAGVTFERIYELIGEVRLVRAMPSLAIAQCDGVTGYTSAPSEVEALFHRLGYAFEVAAADIEKVMAFSACGLGFAAYLIDAFSEAGVSLGFGAETSELIAAQTFRNAIERGGFKQTVKSVATPGGATEQGVKHMDANDAYGIVRGAVQAAYDRMK
ncbi:MAG: NAD(P)-binding domain-containing protein [Oscillospiraceae bacterium]|jgi:pyrroline-5-carboxylate reductase|nr:NAD(P)-binding domain-containing protein [Oscillospiraceae bacterium]